MQLLILAMRYYSLWISNYLYFSKSYAFCSSQLSSFHLKPIPLLTSTQSSAWNQPASFGSPLPQLLFKLIKCISISFLLHYFSKSHIYLDMIRLLSISNFYFVYVRGVLSTHSNDISLLVSWSPIHGLSFPMSPGKMKSNMTINRTVIAIKDVHTLREWGWFE